MENTFAKIHPELAWEWSDKNKDLKPTMVTVGSHKKVIWKGKCGHEWTATCIIFIRGFDPILDNKYIPFAHSMFDQTADGKGQPYIHEITSNRNLIGLPFEILSKKAVEHYEKQKEKGDNVFIDDLKYEEFMLLGEAELNHRFSSLEEKEQKDKLNEEQAQVLEYSQDSESEVQSKPELVNKREKPEWEDTLTNRMLHWDYTEGQKAELQKAVAAKVPKSVIMEYFYPDVSVEQMSVIRENNVIVNDS